MLVIICCLRSFRSLETEFETSLEDIFVSAWLARSSRIRGWIWIKVKGGGDKGG